MPFITYSIDQNYFKNFKDLKSDDLNNFNIDLSDFNLNQKAQNTILLRQVIEESLFDIL